MALFRLQTDHAGPARGVHDAGADAVHGVHAGEADPGEGFLLAGGGNDGDIRLRLDVPSVGVNVSGCRDAHRELNDVLRIGLHAVQRGAVDLRIP